MNRDVRNFAAVFSWFVLYSRQKKVNALDKFYRDIKHEPYIVNISINLLFSPFHTDKLFHRVLNSPRNALGENNYVTVSAYHYYTIPKRVCYCFQKTMYNLCFNNALIFWAIGLYYHLSPICNIIMLHATYSLQHAI